MVYTRIIELLIKQKNRQLNLPEHIELSNLLKNYEMQDIEEFIATSLEFQDYIDVAERDQAFEKIKKRIAKKQAPSSISYKLKKLSAVAAVLILTFTTLLYIYNNKTLTRNSENIILTKKGSKSNITLPDGTQVWINSDTRLTYNKNFGEKKREVYLTGEAFFDVVKNVEIPFIVHTDNFDIHVLGTAFNVKSYINEEMAQTTLLRGSIELYLKSYKKKIIMERNEKIIVKNKSCLYKKDTVSEEALIEIRKIYSDSLDTLPLETLWLKNRIAFDNDKLANAITILERWYNTKIFLKDSSLMNKKISGVFEGKNISTVMEALSVAVGFKYTIDKNADIVIYQ